MIVRVRNQIRLVFSDVRTRHSIEALRYCCIGPQPPRESGLPQGRDEICLVVTVVDVARRKWWQVSPPMGEKSKNENHNFLHWSDIPSSVRCLRLRPRSEHSLQRALRQIGCSRLQTVDFKLPTARLHRLRLQHPPTVQSTNPHFLEHVSQRPSNAVGTETLHATHQCWSQQLVWRLRTQVGVTMSQKQIWVWGSLA